MKNLAKSGRNWVGLASPNDETLRQAFFLKMKADLYRYLAEFLDGLEKLETAETALSPKTVRLLNRISASWSIFTCPPRNGKATITKISSENTKLPVEILLNNNL